MGGGSRYRRIQYNTDLKNRVSKVLPNQTPLCWECEKLMTFKNTLQIKVII